MKVVKRVVESGKKRSKEGSKKRSKISGKEDGKITTCEESGSRYRYELVLDRKTVGKMEEQEFEEPRRLDDEKDLLREFNLLGEDVERQN
jgi:hypothetical protein